MHLEVIIENSSTLDTTLAFNLSTSGARKLDKSQFFKGQGSGNGGLYGSSHSL